MPPNLGGGFNLKQNIAIKEIKEVEDEDPVNEEIKINQIKTSEKKIVPIGPPEPPSPPSQPLLQNQNQFLQIEENKESEGEDEEEQPSHSLVIEVDELKEADYEPPEILIGHEEVQIPEGIVLCNSEFVPTRMSKCESFDEFKNEMNIPEPDPVQFTKVAIFPTHSIHMSALFASLFEVIETKQMAPCAVSAVNFHISFKDNHSLNVILRAVILRESTTLPVILSPKKSDQLSPPPHRKIPKSTFNEASAGPLGAATFQMNGENNSNYIESIQLIDVRRQPKRKSKGCFGGLFRCYSSQKNKHQSGNQKTNFTVRELVDKGVKLVPLSFLPFRHVRKYIGFIDVFHVRELELVTRDESLELLQESFIREASEIMKARARGMGANCVLGYHLADFHMSHDSNYIICVICLTGNAALYDEEL